MGEEDARMGGGTGGKEGGKGEATGGQCRAWLGMTISRLPPPSSLQAGGEATRGGSAGPGAA